jgi:hypothetical protein
LRVLSPAIWCCTIGKPKLGIPSIKPMLP